MDREEITEEIVGWVLGFDDMVLPIFGNSSFYRFCQVGQSFSQVVIAISSDSSSVELVVEFSDIIFLFSILRIVWFN